MQSLKARVDNAIAMAGIEGTSLSARHFAGDETPKKPQNSPQNPPNKPQVGLGMRRSAHKPIPRKYTLQQAADMRVLHNMGIGYRVLSLIYDCAPGCAHHAVTKRGAYIND